MNAISLTSLTRVTILARFVHQTRSETLPTLLYVSVTLGILYRAALVCVILVHTSSLQLARVWLCLTTLLETLTITQASPVTPDTTTEPRTTTVLSATLYVLLVADSTTVLLV